MTFDVSGNMGLGLTITCIDSIYQNPRHELVFLAAFFYCLRYGPFYRPTTIPQRVANKGQKRDCLIFNKNYEGIVSFTVSARL